MTELEREKCHCAIHSAAVAAGALGVTPLPCADIFPISAVQATMIVALALIFNAEITKDAAEEIARTYIVGNMGKIIAGGFAKIVPGIGHGINGAIAAGLTEVLGWEVAEKFAAGIIPAEPVLKEENDDGISL